MAKAKVVLIGLDGAPFELIRNWAGEGWLPNLNSLIKEGAFGTLESTIHPISPIAWTSMLTGKNAGKHGVYDFGTRRPASYERDVVNAYSRRTPILWDWIAKAGGTVGIFNVPMTYPPAKVPGYLVAGLLTPTHNSDFVEPPALRDKILNWVPDYRVPGEETSFIRGREINFLNDLMKSVENHEKAILHLIEEYPDLDFHMFVLMQLDHLHHKLWRYIENPDLNLEVFSLIRKLYLRVDETVGKVRQCFDGDTTFFIVSDHGGGTLEKIVSLNRWLIEKGWLRLKKSALRSLKHLIQRSGIFPLGYRLVNLLGLGWLAKRLPATLQHRIATSFTSFNDVDWSKTKAYACGKYGQIFINLKGREPEGIVEPHEYPILLQEIESELLKLKDPDTGELVVRKVYRKEELYQGPHASEAADLVFAMADYRYDSSIDLGFLDQKIFHPPEFHDTGTHRLEGILIACGKNIRRGIFEKANIMDVAPTVLSLLGLPIPEDLDGKCLSVIFEEPILEKTRKEMAHWQFSPAPTKELSDNEKEEIEKRLRGLGYLG